MRLVRTSLSAWLVAAICVLIPLQAGAETQWVSLKGNDSSNPYSIQIVETSPYRLRLRIGINGYYLEDTNVQGLKSKSICVPGFAPIEEVGAPDLPRLVRALRIPEGADARFSIIEEETRTVDYINVAPSRGPLLLGENPVKKKSARGKHYKQNRNYPAAVFELIEPFKLRDASGVKFVFSPFRYNPVSRELSITTRLVVDLHFESPADSDIHGNAMEQRAEKHASGPIRRSRVFERIHADVFLNGSAARGYSLQLSGTGPASSMQTMGIVPLSGEPVEDENMLIITTPTFSDALQEFIQWKQSLGINVELDTSSAAGGVSAIQDRIRTKYETEGLTYVLLVGDLQDVPSPMVTLISQKASDPSYVLLEGDDLAGDALISRIPANTVAQLQTQLAKIMHYGKGPFADDAWVNHALVGASTSNPNKTSHANQITDTMLAHPHFSEVWRVLQSDSNRTTRVKNAFNVLGINAFTYVGHGTETAMSSLAFSTVTIAQLNGARKAYPFVHTVACKLGNFGHTSDCFAEAILKVGSPSAPAGAVAIAAATEDMYSGHGDRGQLKAFRELYYAEDVETFGSLFFKSTLYAVNCLTGSLAETLYRQWHLFGDCSLPIRKLSSYNAVITVELPAQATEGQGILTGQGRIKLSKAASSELVVDLTSSQPDKAAIPVSVVVPAGAIEVPFDIDIPDDAEITGTKSAEICASAAGWFAGCAGIDVLDNDGGLLVFSSATYVAEEDNQDFFVTLARIGDTHGSISVEINTCNGAASAGMDYLALAQTIIFEDGETEKAIPITIIDDLYQEADETFTVSLSGPFAGQLNTAVITIPFNDQVDYFTEEFLSGNDLSFRSLSLVPDGSVHYYSACTGQVAGFFTDPAGGTPVPLGDNSYARVNLADGAAVGLYGSSHSTLFIGGNGYITFLLGDTTSSASLPYHFLLPRISALFTDLDPSAGGGISCKQLADRVVVTFENVPEKETANSNSFQVELFFNGAVRITWLEIQAQGGIAGLSAGQGQMPGGFIQSDLSVYDACACNLSLKVIDTLSTVDEYAGLLRLTGKVAIETPLYYDLRVALSSSDTTELSVPASATILAGETEAHFDVLVLNDCIADGDQPVTITALAEYGTPVLEVITVRDVGAIQGDLDTDCNVDFDDLNILLAFLGGPSEDFPQCDLNGNRSIDLGDVALLKSGCTCPGCVCADTEQQTDPSPPPPVEAPALGAHGIVALVCALLLLIGRGNLRVRHPLAH